MARRMVLLGKIRHFLGQPISTYQLINYGLISGGERKGVGTSEPCEDGTLRNGRTAQNRKGVLHPRPQLSPSRDHHCIQSSPRETPLETRWTGCDLLYRHPSETIRGNMHASSKNERRSFFYIPKKWFVRVLVFCLIIIIFQLLRGDIPSVVAYSLFLPVWWGWYSIGQRSNITMRVAAEKKVSSTEHLETSSERLPGRKKKHAEAANRRRKGLQRYGWERGLWRVYLLGVVIWGIVILVMLVPSLLMEGIINHDGLQSLFAASIVLPSVAAGYLFCRELTIRAIWPPIKWIIEGFTHKL